MVKTLPFPMQGLVAGVGLIPGKGGKIPHVLLSKKPKHNRSSVVTNSMKTLKIAYIKKKKNLTNFKL